MGTEYCEISTFVQKDIKQCCDVKPRLRSLTRHKAWLPSLFWLQTNHKQNRACSRIPDTTIKLCDVTALFGIFQETNTKLSQDSISQLHSNKCYLNKFKCNIDNIKNCNTVNHYCMSIPQKRCVGRLRTVRKSTQRQVGRPTL